MLTCTPQHRWSTAVFLQPLGFEQTLMMAGMWRFFCLLPAISAAELAVFGHKVASEKSEGIKPWNDVGKGTPFSKKRNVAKKSK